MKYEEKLVAFIDILGFKDLMTDESKCEVVGAILKLPYLMQHGNMARMLRIKEVMMTSISDSLVFSIGLNRRGAMNKITKILSAFTQTLLLHYSLLVRGSIAVGKLYHDCNVAYGPGLVKAYELESKIAIYPRIVMTSSDFERSILSCTEISQSALRKMFLSDTEGLLRLDCLYYTTVDTLQLYRCKFQQMKASDSRAQQKIDWMIATVDKKLEEHALQPLR